MSRRYLKKFPSFFVPVLCFVIKRKCGGALRVWWIKEIIAGVVITEEYEVEVKKNAA